MTENKTLPDTHGPPRIAMVVWYMGRWPAWFDLFLQSCRFNPDVDFLLFTDCGRPPRVPPNVHVVPATLADFNRLASEKLGMLISVGYPYKLCDFQAALGHICEDYLVGYDFWGTTDVDVIYGNIRKFLRPDMLARYDVIACRKEYLTGHFTLFRNLPSINRLYAQSPDYRTVFQSEEHFSFSECNFMWKHLLNGGTVFDKDPDVVSMTHLVKRLAAVGRVRACFAPLVREDVELSRSGWKLIWDRGVLWDARAGEEIMYFHFNGYAGRYPVYRVPQWSQMPDSFFMTRWGFFSEEAVDRSLGRAILSRLP